METLRVGAARSDPPFVGEGGGLDTDLIEALAARLGATAQFVPVNGTGVDEAVAGLGASYDCLAGATVTAEHKTAAAFLPPYLISGQSLAVDTRRLPDVSSVDDLTGLTVGVLRGDTGQSIAERLVADGKAGAVRVYDSGASALADLTTGECDAVIVPGPVLAALVRSTPGVQVRQRGLRTDHIAIAVAPGDQTLLGRLTVAQAELEADGTLQRIRRKWLGKPYADQRLGML